MTTADLIAKVEALPRHSISGYEWECGECGMEFVTGDYTDSQGNVCDHLALLDRELVLRLLRDPA